MKNNQTEKNESWWQKRSTYIILSFMTAFFFGLHIMLSHFKGSTYSDSPFASLAVAIFISCASTLMIEIVQHKKKTALQIREENVKTAEKNIEEMQSKLQSTIEDFNGKNCTFCANSIIAVKRNREECNLEKFFGDAKKEICILATNLSSFKKYADQLCELSKVGIQVKIATIDPEYAKNFNIARVTGNTPPDERKRDMERAIYFFAETKKDLNANQLNLKTYKNIGPTLILILRDGELCYVANLIHGLHARNTVHLLVRNDRKSDSPYAMFERHFNAIFDSNDCQPIVTKK